MATSSPQPLPSTSNDTSPPPNCAICLGKCINKCFTDSCMHQFCFKCLLEWSKVKAVCPLCKQHFCKIKHNVKSDNTYDEHYIERDASNLTEDDRSILLRIPERQGSYDLYLPSSTSRLFQFITSLTVDPRGEFAIQQLLSSHPLTNNQFFYDYMPPGYENFNRYGRRRTRDVSSSNFRRSVYNLELWVSSPPDITGRFREISPSFYRENPAARNRLVPWLNRELNVLLHENTAHVMNVIDTILLQLNHHHIRSQYFKQLLEQYFGSKTDHFIHEFYNYMKSPYDMVGYDRHVSYSTVQPPHYSIRLSDEDESSDSDIAVVSVQQPNPVVIEINSDSSRESDVIMQEPPPPVVVDLLNSDSSETVEEQTKPILPLKIRLKHKRQSREQRRSKRRIKDSSDSEISESSGNRNVTCSSKQYKRKRKYLKSKYYIVKQECSDREKQDYTDTDDSTDNEPILNRLKNYKSKVKKFPKHFCKNQKHAHYSNGESTSSANNRVKLETDENKTKDNCEREIEEAAILSSSTPPLPIIANLNEKPSLPSNNSALPAIIMSNIDKPSSSGMQGRVDNSFPSNSRHIFNTYSDDSISSVD